MARPALTEEVFWSRLDKSAGDDGCWLWTLSFFRGGYGQATYQGKNWKTHRLAAFFSGMEIDGLMVCHKCDVPACCNPSHLFVGTGFDNMRDASEKGRMPFGERNGQHTKPESFPRGDQHYMRAKPELVLRGEKHGRSKFTAAQVTEIRERHAKGDVTIKTLSIENGVTPAAIRLIIKRVNWAHVP